MHVLSVVTIRERERVLNLPETTPNLIFWQLWGLSESELLSAGWCAVTTSVPPNPSQNSNATPRRLLLCPTSTHAQVAILARRWQVRSFRLKLASSATRLLASQGSHPWAHRRDIVIRPIASGT